MKYFYFDTAHAIKEQDFIIENSGGRKGIINIGLVDSVLEHIQNDSYYPEFENKVCHLFYSINKNHAFEDGNKRSSIVLTSYFLEVNGFDFKVSHFIREMENIAVQVADNKIDKDLLQEIITSILYESDYDEALQLKIVNAISVREENNQEETEF
ncbi:type II toxin-antitoxin system death-on-curing family toxin [Flavobacterium sandaracinum]|uniref:Type II toxin-antitoxin system death-on-curing family toxin n=1 Tax=Flavobacterium sandaracinum TaxID=2541733 RepID=A0A4R5CNC5_9FLAO|nr:type II toxin-antitoxin system death-on-curing family toxin [Flavobacterium sandaracinum]TDE01536.1 type II toxin-antitoxin system death-on-curing family toxin [Flavobacterium sandaracinum]